MSTPEARLADRTWRWWHSKWLLVPVLGFGLFTVFSLLYAGRKLHDTQVARITMAFALATAFVWVVLATSNTEPGSKERPVDNIATALIIGLWIGGAVYCTRLNRRLLRHHADGDDSPWYRQPRASTRTPAAAARVTQSSNWPNALGLDDVRQHAFATSPPPPSALTDPGQAETTSVRRGDHMSPTRPVDLNTADEATLRTLPGVGPAVAKRILAHREARGGLDGPQDLASAGVPPHVLAGVLDHVTFARRPTPPRRGRVLDL